MEAHHSAENKSEIKNTVDSQKQTSKLSDHATPANLQEQRAILKLLHSSENITVTSKDGKGQLVMAPLPGYLPPYPPREPSKSQVFRITESVKKPFTSKYPGPVADGQGENVHMVFRGDHPGLAKIGLMQPHPPWAAIISEEVPVTGGIQEIKFHGVAPASKDGFMFSFKMTGVGGVNVQEFSVTPSEGLTQPAHYTMKDGQVIESKNDDVMGKNSLGKTVEMRNGKPFLTGFEIQCLDMQDHSLEQQNFQHFLETNATAATNTPYWSQVQSDPQKFLGRANWAQSKGIEVKEHPALWEQMIPSTDAYGQPMQITPEMIKQHVQEIARMPGQFTEINETADVNTAPDNDVTRWIKKVGPARATELAIEWAKRADPNKTVIYNDYQNGAQEMTMLDQMQKDGKLPDAIGIQLHMDQDNWSLARVEETINQLAKYGKPIQITEISVLSGEHGSTMSSVNKSQIAKMAADFDLIKTNSFLNPNDANLMNRIAQGADSLVSGKIAKEDFVVAADMSNEAKKISDASLRVRVETQIKVATTWASTPEGEKLQADYTENLYKVLHSNPHVQGITWWDLTDKNSWKHAPRGWFREDATPKPVVARMTKLFAQWQAEAASH